MRLCSRSLLVTIFWFATTLLHAQNPLDEYQQFSAKATGSPLNWKGMQVYRSGNQMRGEYTNENEVRLTNGKNRNGWAIRPLDWGSKAKQCVRMSLPDSSSYPFFSYPADKFDVARTATEERTETLNGHSCKVQEYAVKQKETGQQVMMTLWRAEDLKGFPLKIAIKPAAGHDFEINYADVSLTSPDPKLFQIPSLCGAKTAPKKPGVTVRVPAPTKKPSSQTP